MAAAFLCVGSSVFANRFEITFNPANTVVGRDGRYYGNTLEGGPFRGGTVYAISPEQRMRILAVFRHGDYSNLFRLSIYGSGPDGVLGVGSDGAIYGSTRNGGVFGAGLLYKLTPAGRLTTLHHYEQSGLTKGQVYCASDGTIYAGLENSGLLVFSKDGSARQILTRGQITSIVETAQGSMWFGQEYAVTNGISSFSRADVLRLNSQGALEHVNDVELVPHAAWPLVDGSVIYLSADRVQQVFANGAVGTLHVFSAAFEGLQPNAIFQGKDGAVIGSTTTGGLENGGTMFRLVPGTNEYSVLQHLHHAGTFGYAAEWLRVVFPLRVEADAGNRPPMARDDFVDAGLVEKALRKVDAPELEIRVLANDTDADRDAVTIRAVTQPAHGTASIGRGGKTVIYRADATPVLDDSFLYTIGDGKGGTATARVAIRSTPTGRYTGNLTSESSGASGDPGTISGSISLRLGGHRLVAGHVTVLGRSFSFTGRFNEVNHFAKVLISNPKSGQMGGMQLTLHPDQAGLTVDARVMLNGAWFSASCTTAPPTN